MAHVDTFDTFINHQLNDMQREAVVHDKGPLLVIAGAGSGKTRVITARITHLMKNHQIPHHEIVALTFTNKAAQEMKERIIHFLGPEHPMPFIGTFHAYCVRLLKQQSNLLELPPFTILDGDDQLKMIGALLRRATHNKTLTPRQVLYTISQVKNQLVNTSLESTFNNPLIYQIYKTYENEKKVSNCFDFDDLMLEVLKFFKTNPLFSIMHQKRVPHLLVDEYQDTNKVQHELLKYMALTTILSAPGHVATQAPFAIDSLCAVGDEDQSIYSWRGATVANMLDFKKDFATTKIIKVEQNYRSVQPILALANNIIEHNAYRNPKKLWSHKKGVDRIRIITCLSEYQEGEAIAQCLKSARSHQKHTTQAILYRTHVQSRAIEEALIKQLIPYKIMGGIQFYERKEIKDILAYLRLVVNPFDRTSFFRVINSPSRGLGEKFEELFYSYWQDQPFLTFVQIAYKLLEDNTLTHTKKAALEQFVSLFNTITSTTSAHDAVDSFITKTNYKNYVKNEYEPNEAQERIENIQELVDAIRHFETQGITTVDLLLHEIALMQEKMHAQEDKHDNVLLMSLHAAKGLEFDLVIVAGLEEGILPTGRALIDNTAIEEERRLFYVGITRAKEHLLITHTKYRYTYGKMVDQKESRFLERIPPHLIATQDVSSFNKAQLYSIFSHWFDGTGLNNILTVNNTIDNNKALSHTTTSYTTALNNKAFDTHHQNNRSIHFSPSSPPSSTSYQVKPAMHANSSAHNSRPSVSYSSPVTSSGSVVNSEWRKNQPVKHPTYGAGTVEKAEIKNGDTYVTVTFKEGIKKISARFLTRLL